MAEFARVTAKRGVLVGEIGAALAVVATLCNPEVVEYKWIIVALIIGAGIGIPLGLVHMTAVPQRTALSHAFGALSASLIGIAEYYVGTPHISKFGMAEIGLEVIIGSLTFTGSVIAAGKLQEILPQRPITYRGQNIVSLSVLGAALAIMVALVHSSGIHASLPDHGGDRSDIRCDAGDADRRRGHADRHLAVELLRGIFRGAAGIRAQQQSAGRGGRARRLFGLHPFRDHVQGDESLVHERDVRRVRAGAGFSAAAGEEERTVRSATPEEAAPILSAATNVAIVPGYGMAVAQAQHKVRELYDVLSKRGVEVRFGIHPVAGRMPGHMNVLLAEADIPYDHLIDMDDTTRCCRRRTWR